MLRPVLRPDRRGPMALILVFASLLLQGCAAQAAAPAGAAEPESKLAQSRVAAPTPKAAAGGTYYVLELSAAGDRAGLEGAVQVFRSLGASDTEAAAILARVQAEGTAAVMEGAHDALEQVRAAFDDAGLRCTVRQKTSADAEAAVAGRQQGNTPPATAAAGGPPNGEGSGRKPADAEAARASSGWGSASGGGGGTVYSAEYAGTGVDVLDGAGFRAQLAQPDSPPTLVVFFAPWCGHCKKLVPEVAKAAARLQGKGVRVVAVDCDRAPEATRGLGIKGYPTVKFMARGQAAGYEGPRTAMQIAAFAQGRARLEAVLSHVERWLVAPVRRALARGPATTRGATA